MSIPRVRPGAYPAFLSYGFRPFFLFGAIYAAVTVFLWMPIFMGQLELHSGFAPVDWHIHEMLFGYLPAVITGFLLTAIPNWTGRLPVQGVPLLGLVVLWLVGRAAMFVSADIGALAAGIIDCAFLLAVAASAAVEIFAGRNWRNLKVVVPVAVLFSANALFHIEVWSTGSSDVSRRLGIAAAIVLIMIIGGRIIPSFTRNWLVRENPGRLPAPFDRFDVVAIGVSVAALALWTVLPEQSAAGWALAAAAALNLVRLARWAGDRTLADTLVLILHVAFLFVPVGLALSAAAVLLPDLVPLPAATHALTVGAIGCMTLAVMARASLGHTGQELKAGPALNLVFASIVAAALLRIVVGFSPDLTVLLYLSAAAWIAAFGGFSALFAPLLVRPRMRRAQPSGAR